MQKNRACAKEPNKRYHAKIWEKYSKFYEERKNAKYIHFFMTKILTT